MRPQAKDAAASGQRNNGASWPSLGLIGIVFVIMALAMVYMLRSGSYGINRNRGPGTEALPGPRGIDPPPTR